MNKKGITLVALTITILVMTILGSAAVGSVVGIVSLGRKDAFEATTRLVREQVEIVYQETMTKKYSNEDFDEAFRRMHVPDPFTAPTPIPANAIPNETLSIIASKYGMTVQQLNTTDFFRVNNLETKEFLNIETTDLNFYVNFERNIVFSMTPIKFNNKNVFTLEEIDSTFNIGKKSIDISQVLIGDTVIYDPTKGVTDTSLLTYTSPVGSAMAGFNVSGNGNSSQSLTATSSHNQYIVIDKENGRLKLMSKSLVSLSGSHFTANNGQGFLFFEEEAHKMCSIFGHGTGADKSLVTTYTVGNPANTKEIKVKKLKNSGARSMTLADLEVMTTTNLRGDDSVTNPTVDVYIPTLQGTANNGRSADTDRMRKLAQTYKVTQRTGFTFKADYASIGLNNIFIDLYHLADRAINSTSTTANFMVMGVNSTSILGNATVAGTNTNYTNTARSRYFRPIVYLSPDVKIERTATPRQWNVVQ